MTKYKIIEVKSDSLVNEFLDFPSKHYSEDPNYIEPLREDIIKVFDEDQNKLFKNGECVRFIITNQDNITLGRVACFIDYKTKDLYPQSSGGVGFFECINCKEAAFLLFDRCKDWLKDKNIEAMNGPINFGERNQWWGLLTSGFQKPSYAMPYNYPYYKELFEEYGFQTYFNQYSYRTVFDPKNLSKIIVWKAKRISADKNYRVENFNKSNPDKYIKDFAYIYNEAWVNSIPGIEGISVDQAYKLFENLKPILEEKLLWFTYYKDEPIGFVIMMPDLNELLQHLKGKINWLGKLRFLYFKHLQKNKTAMGVIFGIIPKFQSKGAEAAMMYKFSQVGFEPKFKYKNLELSWIGDFNPRMMHLMDHINAKIYRTHVTYRKIFDESIPFERAKIVK